MYVLDVLIRKFISIQVSVQWRSRPPNTATVSKVSGEEDPGGRDAVGPAAGHRGRASGLAVQRGGGAGAVLAVGRKPAQVVGIAGGRAGGFAEKAASERSPAKEREKRRPLASRGRRRRQGGGSSGS